MYPAIFAKRSLALILVLCLLLVCFTGCGRKKAEKPTEPATIPPQLMLDATEAPEETTAPTEAPTEATEAATEATKENNENSLPGVVAGDSVNVRSGPGINYGTSDILKVGTKVEILEVNLKNELPWGRIQEGWICLDYVQLDNPDDLLQYSSSELGITLNKNIQLYNGPGTFYGNAGVLGKDVRLNIFGTVGKWARIAEGWLLLDHIYIDGTEGPEEPVKGTVTGYGVNIRSGPGTQYSVITIANKDNRVKIFHIMETKDGDWGCTDVGWIFMDYVLLDGEVAAQFLGTWCGYNSTDQMDSSSHIFVEWNFTSSGKYTCNHWIYNESMSDASEMILASSSSEGTYKFEDDELFMNDKKVSYTLQDNKLYLDAGFGSKAHLKGKMEDAVKAFLAEKYPNSQPDTPTEGTETPAPPAMDASIVGSWSAARAFSSADGVLCFTMGDNWTFNSDGTFRLTENTSFWVYGEDGSLGQFYEFTPVNKSGTFTFDGTNLQITLSDGSKGSGTASVQNGVLVVTWSSGSESMYKGSAADLAAKLFPN